MRYAVLCVFASFLFINVACKSGEPAPPAEQVKEEPAPAPEPAAAADDAPPACELKPVHFKTAGNTPTDEGEKALAEDATCIKSRGEVAVYIECHTDDRRENEFNLALAERYAGKVRDALVKGGVAMENILTIPYGEEKPSCLEQTPECRDQNRRCDLRVE